MEFYRLALSQADVLRSLPKETKSLLGAVANDLHKLAEMVKRHPDSLSAEDKVFIRDASFRLEELSRQFRPVRQGQEQH